MNISKLSGDIASDSRAFTNVNDVREPVILPVIQEILGLLKKNDVIAILFLLTDIEQLKRRELDSFLKTHPDLLRELLYTIKRFDLLKKTGLCRHEFERQFADDSERKIDKFWRLLYEVCEALTPAETQVDLSEEKFILKLYNKKLFSRTNVTWLVTFLTCIGRDPKVALVIRKLQEYQKEINALSSGIEYYEMNSRKWCGMCIITNMDTFTDPVLHERAGSEADVVRLSKTFRRLGFAVLVRNNLNYGATCQLLEQAAAADHSQFSCFVFALLTHGDEDDLVYTRDGGKLFFNNIVRKFNSVKCPSLHNKPKLFITPACRGNETMTMTGISLAQSNSDSLMTADSLEERKQEPASDAPQSTAEIPRGSYLNDYLVCYSTVPGYTSQRNKLDGIPYIRILCQLLDEFGGKEHITDILTRVKSIVPDEPADILVPGDNRVQAPNDNNALRKRLQFRCNWVSRTPEEEAEVFNGFM